MNTKRLAMLMMGASTLLLAGCRWDSKPVSSETPADLSSTTQSMTEKLIKEYLANANKNIQDQTVVSGDKITVDYIGRLDASEVFDTSIQNIAEAAGKFSPARDYSAGLSFTVGAGQMIAGFDAGVQGMKLGETKTITIPAAEAYGEVNPELIVRIPRESAGDISNYTVGMTVYLETGMPVRITDITDTEIELDANPELAGKDLIFDITIKSIDNK